MFPANRENNRENELVSSIPSYFPAKSVVIAIACTQIPWLVGTANMFDRNRELSSKNREIRGRHAVLAGMGVHSSVLRKAPYMD
jgi:hypothetical protein